jgi:proteasome lid subunit RPN8/RPN11
VKLNLFNYFEKKSKVALNKYEKAVERNNEIILHFATHPRHRRCFLSPNRNLQPCSSVFEQVTDKQRTSEWTE